MPNYPIIHKSGKARGIFCSESEKMTLLTGSQLSIDLNHTPRSNIKQNYRSVGEYLKKEWLRPIDGGLLVERDITNVSVSAAGVFVSGKPGSGWMVWLLEDGRPLDVLRNKGASPLPTPRVAVAATPPSITVRHVVLDRAKSLKHLAEVRDEIRSNPHSRWLSWNHCYEFFRQANVAAAKQQAALHLGFYLASWGMLRNSKLINKNHLFHEPLVGLLTSPEAGKLGTFPTSDADVHSHVERISSLSGDIASHLRSGQVSPTLTLLSKILLGTTAAIPALDAQARQALKDLGIRINSTNDQLGERDLHILFALARDNMGLLQEGATLLSERGFEEYPPMKVLDMILWTAGTAAGVTDEKAN
jgi:hypothetical protein